MHSPYKNILIYACIYIYICIYTFRVFQTEASYYFKSIVSGSSCKSWLKIDPDKYTLQVG